MYQPKLRQGEKLLKSSPGVRVKNVDFDAFLTDKRIIFAKTGDELYERKELVFPLGFIKDYTPSADEKGIPRIILSVQKPEGDKGDMILNFIQKGDYRFAERDDWIEKLGRMVEKEPPVNTPPPVQEPALTGDPFASLNTQKSPAQVPQGFEPHQQNAAPVHEAKPARNISSGQFCRFCGSKIPPDSAFCPSCGGKVAAPATGAAAPAKPHTPPPAPSRPAYSDNMSREERGFVPPPPPQRQAGFAEDNFRAPPPPPSTRSYSLADDPAYNDYEQGETGNSRRRKPDRSEKAALKEEKRAEKARQKEEARYRKEQKKAGKNAGRGPYDDYGKTSRIPENLPKILIPAVIAVVVIGIVAFVFTSGMFGGSGGNADVPNAGTGGTATDNTGSSSGTTSSGTSQTTADYDKGWEVRVIYSGEWTGTFGSGSNMQTETGFGSQTFEVTNPSGSITATFKKADGGAGQIMFVDLLKDSKVMETGDTTDSGGSVTVTASL